MNRDDFQRLASERVQDAGALIAAARWSGAYYLAGYAVECALKACIAKLTREYDFPDKDLVQKYYTHKLESLVGHAKLEDARESNATANAAFNDNWRVVKDWDERARYKDWTEEQARKLYAAVADPADGVLVWITGHW